jgi:ABC-type branched-subunit amino acid transport system permease subunit
VGEERRYEENCIGVSVAGYAGALFAMVNEFVSPTIFGFGFSTDFLIWVAMG